MGQNSEDEFVRAGFTHYATALRTIDRFAYKVLEQLTEILTSARPWSNWKPGDSEPKKQNSRAGSPWIAAGVDGALASGEPASLWAGLWWRPEGLVAYVGFEAGPERVRRGLAVARGSPTRTIKGGSCNYFARDVQPSSELELAGTLGTLFEEVDGALARAAALSPPGAG